MDIKDVNTLFFSGASVSAGAVFGALRSKIMATKHGTILPIIFYAFAGIVIIGALILLLNNWSSLTPLAWIGFGYAIIAGVAMALVTWKYLTVRDTFSTNELNPIINQFTEIADTSDIKLLGGDFNFFGQSPADMDGNIQYNFLKKKQFNHIYILCERPGNNLTKIRYGKILNDMPTAELGFYEPEKADLKVRGRIIKASGVDRLLVYTKVASGQYRAIETDRANSNGALYNNIWELVWTMATLPTSQQIQENPNLFLGK